MTHEEYVKAAEYWKNKEQIKMPKEQLQQAVIAYIDANNTCAFATGTGDYVRCTPIEYSFHDGKFWMSDGYLSWLDQALDIRTTANYDLDGIDYDIRICDSPAEMEDIVIEKNRIRNRSRILAGYCWDWPKTTRNNTNFHDIKIGDYEISWNLDGGDAFAIGQESVHEAGCIHTSQGLEFDYVGVIIGDDMRYENGKIVTDYTKRAKTDNSLKGIKTLAKEDKEKAKRVTDEIIKNTYRTLMTRGMKGCYVYCTDAALAQHFKKLLEKEKRGKKL